MNSALIEKELTKIKNNFLSLFKDIDNESLLYLIQTTEQLYNDISLLVYDKDKLYDLVCNNFKNDINIVLSNMKDYYLITINNLIEDFVKVVKVSVFNKYISSNNLGNVYNNFKSEIITNTNIDNKIKVLSSLNGNLLLNQIHTNCVTTNYQKIENIISNSISMIQNQMIKNINDKNEIILNLYNGFIHEIADDAMNEQDIINKANLKMVINTTYNFLKEQEYFVIEKYINENDKLINKFFDNIDNFGGKNTDKKSKTVKLNKVKDYFCGFNNTIRVKAKNIFDEMNSVIALDESMINQKMNEFSDLMTHIYEIDIKFDKQFDNYKKECSFNGKLSQKFNDFFDGESQKLTEGIKLNITNIFRENTKIYNDVVYRSILLKSRISEFAKVLTEKKVKDLLTK